ncbi:hypothetical protein Tco_1370909, partial [Tanacetum coccineum]
ILLIGIDYVVKWIKAFGITDRLAEMLCSENRHGCINLEEIVYSDDGKEVGAEADMNNLATTVPVSPILTTRVHKDHPLEQII